MVFLFCILLAMPSATQYIFIFLYTSECISGRKSCIMAFLLLSLKVNVFYGNAFYLFMHVYTYVSKS